MQKKHGRLIPTEKRGKEIKKSNEIETNTIYLGKYLYLFKFHCCFISFPLLAMGISLPFFCVLFWLVHRHKCRLCVFYENANKNKNQNKKKKAWRSQQFSFVQLGTRLPRHDDQFP